MACTVTPPLTPLAQSPTPFHHWHSHPSPFHHWHSHPSPSTIGTVTPPLPPLAQSPLPFHHWHSHPSPCTIGTVTPPLPPLVQSPLPPSTIGLQLGTPPRQLCPSPCCSCTSIGGHTGMCGTASIWEPSPPQGWSCRLLLCPEP